MEDILDVYRRPLDPKRPLVCLDEGSKQLFNHSREPLPMQPTLPGQSGHAVREDYEYVRDEKSAVQWVRARLIEKPQTLGDLTPPFMQELREWPTHEPRPELRDILRDYFIQSDDLWRVPDPNNVKDLEELRRNAMLKLFRDYTISRGPLKSFRTEAVLEGFRHCWESNQYSVIVAVCEKIPDNILQEIQEFVTFYDIAKDLAPTQEPQTAFAWE